MPAPITLAQMLSNLQTAGLERLDAQLLLLHVLGLPDTQRGWLLAHDSDVLTGQHVATLQQLLQRRLNGEPLAYLTGHKAFFGLELAVDKHVLVPRPDTETLVDWALALLSGTTPPPKACPTSGEWPPSPGHAPWRNGPALSVLDLGTGSGAIALALKAQLPTLDVHAIDLSPAALRVAQANAQRLNLVVNFSQGAWFDGLRNQHDRFNCVVSNPPYIAEGDPHLSALQHEPTQALTSGADGLDDIRLIIAQAPKHLLPGGWLLLEHGHDQAAAVRALLRSAGFAQVQSRCDLAGIERCSGGQTPAQRN